MLLFIGIFCILATTFLYLLHYSVRGGRKGELIDKIPGPYSWPFIGNTFDLMGTLEELWNALLWLNDKYYPINRIWSVTFPAVNIYDPDDVEIQPRNTASFVYFVPQNLYFVNNLNHTNKVSTLIWRFMTELFQQILLSCRQNIEKSILYNFLHPWLGTGLLTSKGKKWHERRKILTPAFHFKILEQFVEILIKQSEKLAQSMCLEGDEVVSDLVSLLHKYTLNSICETTMGLPSDVDGNVLNDYRSCVSEMGDVLCYRVMRPLTHVDWIFRFCNKFKQQVRILKVLHGFSTNIINERKRYHERTGGRHLEGLGPDSRTSPYVSTEEDIQGKRRLAMLDLLILASKQGADIDADGIREEVDTFVFEGHDTTAMGLCFALMLLAENKEIQSKARAEVDAVFGRRDRTELSLRDLQNLPYLERCIKESLRLFPSVPFISRHISKDIQFKNYLVPAGTVVNVFFYQLHRDPNFWPNPEVFDPDRFLPDQVRGRHPFAYLPFSAGPRNCIGRRFATLEMKALVGTFLNNFYLEPIDLSSEVRIRSDLILRPTSPIRIKLIRRSRDD